MRRSNVSRVTQKVNDLSHTHLICEYMLGVFQGLSRHARFEWIYPGANILGEYILRALVEIGPTFLEKFLR